MRRIIVFLAIACVIASVASAGKKDRKRLSKADRAAMMAQPVASVGTNVLSGSDLEAIVVFRAAPSEKKYLDQGKESSGGTVNVGSQAINEKNIKKSIRAALSRPMVAEFIENELLAVHAREKGLAPDAEALALVTREVESFISSKKKLAKFRSALAKMAERHAFAVAARRDLVKGLDGGADSATISNVIRNISLYNARVDATNAAVRVTADRVYRAASAPGADFEAIAVANGVAGAMSDLTWEPMDAETFEEESPEVFARIRGVKVGSVISPVESDNGMLVCKLLSKTPARDDDPEMFTVAAMRFAFAARVPEGNPAEIAARLENERRQDLFKRTIDEIGKRVKVEVDEQMMSLF